MQGPRPATILESLLLHAHDQQFFCHRVTLAVNVHKGPMIGHHYPVWKKDGGTETVQICPNCHQAVHQGLLISATETTNESEYQNRIEEITLKAIKEMFPQLWNTGDFFDPFHKKYILNPSWKFKRAES